MSTANVREAIDKLSATFSAEPAKARAKNAPAMSGAASAPNPGWFLRAALAACTTTAIAMRAARLGIKLEQLELTVESESDSRGLLGLDKNVSAGLSAGVLPRRRSGLGR